MSCRDQKNEESDNGAGTGAGTGTQLESGTRERKAEATGVKSESVPDTRLSSSSFDFSLVVARHVMLLDGREIVTWPQIEEKLAKHAYPSPAHPGFYVTRARWRRGGFEPAQQEMFRLKAVYKFAPVRLHTLSHENSFRYDRSKRQPT